MLMIYYFNQSFVSSQFGKFTNYWDFEHMISDPYHPREDRKAEAKLKVSKYKEEQIWYKACSIRVAT